MRRKAAPGTLQVRQRMTCVDKSMVNASPKLLSMKAMCLLSGETSARSPKCVRTSMFEGRWSNGVPGLRCARPGTARQMRSTKYLRKGEVYQNATNDSGYGILLRIEQISGHALSIEQGALYPALYRLQRQGLLATEWGVSDNNRRAKYYSLTRAGQTRLQEELKGWNRLVRAMGTALDAKPSEV